MNNNNKKKYAIAIGAFILFFGMFVFAIKAQTIYANKLTEKQESAQAAKSKASADKSKQSKSTKDTKEVKKEANASTEKQSAASSSTASTSAAKDNKTNSSSTNNSSSASGSSNTQATAPTAAENIKVKPDDPDEQMGIQFVDAVHGNTVFLSKNVDDMDGETVGYITEKVLDGAGIKYKCNGSASTVYFAAVNGLEEKKAGKLSGWCYYMKKKGDSRFHKPNVGSGQWVYHKGDIIVWKYLSDGINDGYEDDWGKSSF